MLVLYFSLGARHTIVGGQEGSSVAWLVKSGALFYLFNFIFKIESYTDFPLL